MVFCHRFYAQHAYDGAGEADWHVVAPACLFLAGKVEETPKALQDVVHVSYLLRMRGKCAPGEAEAKLTDQARAGRRSRARSAALGFLPLRRAPRSPPHLGARTALTPPPQAVRAEEGEKILAAERKLLHTLNFQARARVKRASTHGCSYVRRSP